MWRITTGLLLTLVFASGPRTLAQAPGADGYIHESWTVEDGLPVNHVNQVYQTPDGYLWIATFDGVVRFDGVRFTVYNVANTPSLPTNRFSSIQRGLGGDFWLTTEQNHLVRFRDGQFTTMNRPDLDLHESRVWVDGDSALWVTTTTARFRWIHNRSIQ